MNGNRSFDEHRVPVKQGAIYVRDYGGAEPAFVLRHGFPDPLVADNFRTQPSSCLHLSR